MRGVAIADESGDLPDVARGGRIDAALSNLIADVGTAREWYAESAQRRAGGSRVKETLTAPGGAPDMAEIAERAAGIAEEAGDLGAELRSGSTSASLREDNAVRRVRDTEVLARQASIEAGGSEPRLRLLDRLGRAVRLSAEYVVFALRAVQVGADFTKITVERLSAITTRTITIWPEEIGGWAADLEAAIRKHQAEWAVGDGVAGRRGTFRDRLRNGRKGPEMVVLPAGSFLVGSPDGDRDARPQEKPQHLVTIREFALARYLTTFEEYDAFCAATNRDMPDDKGWGRGRRPVINVSWEDAKAYCAWLSEESGAEYRLPSESEWEYACRAGEQQRFPGGDEWDPQKAHGVEEFPAQTLDVGSFPPNAWGLRDMIGNVWEWVEDSWNENYVGAPSDGSPWLAASNEQRVVRGGPWRGNPNGRRSAGRHHDPLSLKNFDCGFRVAQSLIQ